MDWLTRLPVIGPLVAWVQRTRVYRVYEHFNDVGSNRMAWAVTFYGVLALSDVEQVLAGHQAARR